jgi:hypothetical protein
MRPLQDPTARVAPVGTVVVPHSLLFDRQADDPGEYDGPFPSLVVIGSRRSRTVDVVVGPFVVIVARFLLARSAIPPAVFLHIDVDVDVVVFRRSRVGGLDLVVARTVAASVLHDGPLLLRLRKECRGWG